MQGTTLSLPEWFFVLAALVGLVGGIIGAVNGYRVMKRTSPMQEIKKEAQDKWSEFYAKKWDPMAAEVGKLKAAVGDVSGELILARFGEFNKNIEKSNARISAVSDAIRGQGEFLPLLLKANQQILLHLADGNHNGQMKSMSAEIQDALYVKAIPISDGDDP